MTLATVQSVPMRLLLLVALASCAPDSAPRVAAGGLELVLAPDRALLPAAGIALATRGAPVAVQASGEGFVYARGDLVEAWAPRSDGFEQTFVVAHLPVGADRLEIGLAVDGAEVRIDPGGASAAFLAPDTTVYYRDLAAWDAGGEPLAARMEPAPGGLVLAIDVAGARLPITVDPVLTLAWSAESATSGSLFGESLAMGDVNGDGLADLLVGCSWCPARVADTGEAYAWFGSAAGPAVNPDWTAAGSGMFGQSIAAGDVDGDGHDDVIVGGYSANEAWLYPGSAAGPALLPTWKGTPDQAYSYYGWSAASGGDVNGDGYDDVAIGAPFHDGARLNQGRVYVYLGSALGPQLGPWIAESGIANCEMGHAVALGGDVDADGYGDLLIGASACTDGELHEGMAWLFRGSAAGLEALPAWTLQSDTPNAWLGEDVAFAGDLNGDGYDDVAIGVTDAGLFASAGRALVFYGSAAGLGTQPDAVIHGVLVDERLGYSVAGAGDVDQDGYEDLLVGGTGAYLNAIYTGRIALHRGSAAGVDVVPAWDTTGLGNLGESVAGGGDVDGDGYPDIAAAATYETTLIAGLGRVYLYGGSCVDPVDTDGDGVGDACDACPGWDDAADADLDYTPDGCDLCPGADDGDDIDGDGVPAACDGCPDDFDPLPLDTDGDGVGNACDACPGADDALDADGDSAPDGCDACPGADDRNDVDRDGAPDDCDACPDFDDFDDADGDGIGAGCDRCPEVADPGQEDADLDTVGDACDACPGFDDAIDGDGDGAADGCDGCPAIADPGQEDADLDTVDDLCDRCPGADDRLDLDGDGVPDGCDTCSLGDDAMDRDADGVADACDPCPDVVGGEDVDGDGFSLCSGDCFEGDPGVYPGAGEVADGVDEDCDGVVDEGTAWSDDDGDGVAEITGDCDDGNNGLAPGLPELCDGLDQDCDGAIDEGTACADDDGDGFSELAGDCADADPSVYPGAVERLDNRVDDDCDGVVDPGHWDPDGDGVEIGDCEPLDPAIFPGNTEVANGVDDDCDGGVDEGTAASDDDGDGFSEDQGDCDDTRAAAHPGATETADGTDESCNGLIDEGTPNFDDDGDGYAETGGDCDDARELAHPGAAEQRNGVDDDCDGAIDEGTDDIDGDGWTTALGDCDDGNGWRNPEQQEVCDGLDNDCNGAVDDDCAPPARTVVGAGRAAESAGCATATPGSGLALLAAIGLLRRRAAPRGAAPG
jgi:hypothetical protein